VDRMDETDVVDGMDSQDDATLSTKSISSISSTSSAGSRAFCRLLAAALLSLWLTALPAAAQTAPELTRQAVEAYQAGNLPIAIDKLRQAHKLAPEDAQVKLYLGLLLYEEDSHSPEAQQLMESVAGRFPENVELQVKLMDSYLAQGDTLKGLGQLNRLKGATAEELGLAIQVVYLLIQHNQTAAASEEVGKIAARSDSRGAQGEIMFLQGLIAASGDHKDEAMRLLQQADRHDFPPRDSYQMLILADALYRLQELDLASQAYREYLRHHPGDTAARMRLGLSLYSLGLFERAQSEFETVRAEDPRFPEVNYYLAEILFAKNALDEAEKVLREELRHEPKSGRCLAKLARIHYQRGEMDLCEQILERVRKLEPDWPEVHLVSGLVNNRKGLYKEAVKDLQQVVRELPDFPTGHLQLSIAYARSGQAEKAKEHRDIYNRLIDAQKEPVAAGARDERQRN
jgi:tetratricopeptide (TPR) repeat protein